MLFTSRRFYHKFFNLSTQRTVPCVREPTRGGIIISTLEIVQSRLGVVVITSVAEGVNGGDAYAGGIGNDGASAPGIVLVACYNSSVCIGNCNYVALQVLKEIVCVILIDNTANAVLVVVERNKGVFSPGFLENLSSVKGIGVGYAVYSLACSYTVCIVGISVTVKGLKLFYSTVA